MRHADRIRDRSSVAIVDYLRRGLATPSVGSSRRPTGRSNPMSSISHTILITRDSCSTKPAIRIRTAMARGPALTAVAEGLEHGIQPAAVGGDPAESPRRRHRSRTCGPTSLPPCTPTSSKATSRCTRCSGQRGATADPDILSRVFHSQQVPPAGFNRGHLSDPELRSADRRSHARDDDRRAPRALRRSAATRRRARSLHQPLARDEHRHRAARDHAASA